MASSCVASSSSSLCGVVAHVKASAKKPSPSHCLAFLQESRISIRHSFIKKLAIATPSHSARLRRLHLAFSVRAASQLETSSSPASKEVVPDTQVSIFKGDNLHTKCHISAKEVEHERIKGEEELLFGNELADKTSVLQQARKQDKEKAIIPVGATFAATLALALAGLFSCSQAWAGPDIANAQDAASFLGDLDDIKSGFVSAFLLIFFSEIGDKTFFIAAVLASRKSNAAVFTGTFGALVAMTFISVFLGRTFHYIDGILPFSLGENELPLDDLAAVVLLVYFGISTLLDAASMEGSKAEEEQQEAELAIAGLGGNGKGSAISNTALATFGLVFVAEWGDKSFFSTVALSAASSPIGVVSGAIAGHGIATLLAVLGGSLLSSYISEKVTAYIGGSLFLIFAAFTLYEIIN